MTFLRPVRLAGWQRLKRHPLMILTGLSMRRVLHASGGETEDLDASVEFVLGLLALPGVLASFLLFDKYSTFLQFLRGRRGFNPFVASLPDEYFFIVLSMAVSGAVAVWKWHSIFPDKRDYLTLVPLPISAGLIFFANCFALIGFAGLLSIDVNLGSMVLFPTIASASNPSIRFFAVFASSHAVAILLAGAFSFLIVFSAVGLLMLLLPPSLFLRVSLLVRFVFIAAFFLLLISIGQVSSHMHGSGPGASLEALPSVWFVAICHVLRPGAAPEWWKAAETGVIAFGIALGAALLTYSLAYLRVFHRILETGHGEVRRRGWLAQWLSRCADRWFLKTPFERGVYRFAIKTLLRSDGHRLLLSSSAGLGLILALRSLLLASGRTSLHAPFPSASVLSMPLILAVSIVVGTRFLFDIPSELRANGIFQWTLGTASRECAPLGRKVMLTFILPWLVFICAPLYALQWGWTIALLHVAVVTTATWLLIELLVARSRKVPFTCSPPVFQQNSVAKAILYFLLFLLLTTILANMEEWALHSPLRFLVLVFVFVLAWAGIRKYRRDIQEIDEKLVFEETPTGAVELLNLSRS